MGDPGLGELDLGVSLVIDSLDLHLLPLLVLGQGLHGASLEQIRFFIVDKTLSET